MTDRGIGRVEDGEVALLKLPHPDLGALLRESGTLDSARTAAVVDRVPLDTAVLRCPVSRPLGIWGVGLNYHAKAALTGRPVPDEPILFFKPAPALAGPGDALPIPSAPSAELDYEAEVAILIGQRLANADLSGAWAAVAGITAANDMTARDIMRTTNAPFLAKGFDGFSPIGPSVRTVDELAPDFDVAVRSWVNGELRQEGRTGDFIFAVADLLARISRYSTLQPGDVVLTGTPPGTGQDRGEFLRAGDRLMVCVDGLLPLENVLGTPTVEGSIGD